MNPQRRTALVDRLREEVERTRNLFDAAKREHDAAVERTKELGPAHPDGFLERATIVYTRTLIDYSNALNRFNRLILDGRVPPDEDPQE